MKLALLLLALAWIAATLLSLVRTPAWWARVFDFPRVQITIGLLATLALFGVVNLGLTESSILEGVVGLTLAGCAVYQGARIAPYTPLAPTESVRLAEPAKREQVLHVVVSNVLMSNRDKGAWLRVVRGADPDVIVTLESSQWWQDNVFAELAEDYPHAVEVPQEDTYGMHLYSRLPLSDVAVKRRVDDLVPSIDATVALPDGARIDLILLHPMPPRPEFGQDTDRRDAELVLVAREVADRREAQPDRPVLVVGDLNDVAWSRTTRLFQELSGLLDPRRGRGFYNTFHADHRLLRWPLDHVFHSDDLRLVHLERLGYVGSDHFPMHVAFARDPEAARRQDGPDAEADASAEADAILDEASERAAERDAEDEPDPEER